jgi:hypothetical protein
VNPPKNEFFGAMAHLETDRMEFDHMVHQSPKTGHHLRHFPLVIHPRQKQMFIGPLKQISQIHKEPSPGNPFRRTSEGGLDVFVPATYLQAKEQLLIVSGRE